MPPLTAKTTTERRPTGACTRTTSPGAWPRSARASDVSGHDLERMEEVRLGAPPDTLNVFSPDVDAGSGWIDAYQVRSALRLRRADEAVAICERILSGTDPRLVWQVAEALVLLAEAWAMKRELGAAASRLGEAAELARATENERDMRAVRKVLNLMRQRWAGAPEVRRLDELLRFTG
jgi:hypothetical protein